MEEDLDVQRKLAEEKVKIIQGPGDRAGLTALYGEVWDVQEVRVVFTIHGFLAPYVRVTRKADGREGTIQFYPGEPRYYFNFEER